MGARGVLFALDALDAERILACRGDDEVIALVEEVEEGWARDHLFELDKSWDALHRCLTDGDLAFGNGEYPLSHVILGGGSCTRATTSSVMSPRTRSARSRQLSNPWMSSG